MLARLSEGLGLCGRLNDHSTPAYSPSESLLAGYIIDCRLYRNQNYDPNLDANGVINKQVH